nr:NADH dehydrogenase subunit 5 [Micropodarke fujianensis]
MSLNLNMANVASKFLWLMTLMLLPLSMWTLLHMKTYIIEWSILSMYSTQITLPIILDPIGMMFCVTVLFISSNVMQFAITYMSDETHLARFTYLVLLFVLSMNLLIFIPHMMSLLIGWDGLGLVSFLLVIFYQNPKSLAAGMITALTNRIGDALILLAIALTLSQGHWLILNMWNSSMQLMIIMLITLAAMTKSAQIPFSSWLPAAMAAPTPVSALVHSSTLVTAGVFLLIRFYPFLSSSHIFNSFLLCAATTTMLMAGFNAMAECDLKKIIALSTLSQLGVMMSSTALGLPMLTFFHLLTHALFKALLFLCAGTLIHLHHHSQDLRTVGNLMSQMPTTMAALLSANLALCGLPFMAGFYSKDLIIEMSMFSTTNYIIITMFLLATMLTAAYSVRLTITALSSPNMSLPIQTTFDEDTNVTSPMLFLSGGAITGGCLINWIMIAPAQEPYLNMLMKWSPFIVSIAGGLLSIFITLNNKSIGVKIHKMYSANAFMWFLAPLSTQQILSPTLRLSHNLLKSGDHGWMELMGPQGLSTVMIDNTGVLQRIQKLTISSHLTLILIVGYMLYM